MTLPLKPETLEAAYEYLRTTPPFDRWQLPEGEDIVFKVTRSKHNMGEYYFHKGKHHIAVSAHLVGHTPTLMALVAHECVHLFQRISCMESKAMHNEAFRKLANSVCKSHGFDPKFY